MRFTAVNNFEWEICNHVLRKSFASNHVFVFIQNERLSMIVDIKMDVHEMFNKILANEA